MGMFFIVGEQKTRPGVYQRYFNAGGAAIAGAVNGLAAVTYRSNWGPIGDVTEIGYTEAGSLNQMLGSGKTVDAVQEAFNGGAVTVLAVRLGSGGTYGTLKLKDGDVAPKNAVELSTKYPGSRALKVTVRDKLGDGAGREFLVMEGDAVREKLEFSVSADGEVDELIAAINSRSAYFTAKKANSYAGAGKMGLVAEAAITPGTDPEVTNQDYSDAFVLLEPYRFNTLAVDTEDAEVHALLAAYVERVYKAGKLEIFGVVGEPTSVALATRMEHAAAFNSYNMVYVGGGAVLSTGTLEGYRAAARMAGMIAAAPSSESLTHRAVSGAVGLVEKLTDSQYTKAIKSGMLTFSAGADSTVWIEQGITTLVKPMDEDDEGWKKIKRTKIRKELMARVNDSIEPLIGKINNNTDGQANVIKIAKGVLKVMNNEEKILPGYSVELDPANPPVGDSAWFLIYADDVDSLEKGYFAYGFRYNAAAV